MLSEMSDRKNHTSHDFTYIWNLKYGTNKPIYKAETDSETQRTDLWLVAKGGRGMDWEFELIDVNNCT